MKKPTKTALKAPVELSDRQRRRRAEILRSVNASLHKTIDKLSARVQELEGALTDSGATIVGKNQYIRELETHLEIAEHAIRQRDEALNASNRKYTDMRNLAESSARVIAEWPLFHRGVTVTPHRFQTQRDEVRGASPAEIMSRYSGDGANKLLSENLRR